MGCFWSKDDEEPVRSPRRSPEEIRRTTLRRSVPQYTVTSTYYPSYTSGINQFSRLQTPRTNQNIIVPIATPRSNNSVIRQRSGPVSVNQIGEIKCRPASVRTSKPDSKLRGINKKNDEGPKFGEYKCKNCSRLWNSRLCWPDEFQMCKSCHNPTYAYNHRELVPSDTAVDADKKKEHPKEFCGKCKQLGRYCNTKDYKPKKYYQSSTRQYKRY